MTKAKTGWLLLGVFLLASYGVTQDTTWEKYMEAAMEAYQQGQYTEAEKQSLAALKEAEKFGPNDQRLAMTVLVIGPRCSDCRVHGCLVGAMDISVIGHVDKLVNSP